VCVYVTQERVSALIVYMKRLCCVSFNRVYVLFLRRERVRVLIVYIFKMRMQ